ncbi:glycosyltransferase [Streptomyces minutiscleroticus]|uniref:Trehalose synthase n=1 Tax=Streptomyces minutiscleroticus TaxID=68238 RepID=A0A918NS38_9ACTN|nr:glycosyltransferase [Streptomyces minutiscleroticus]GGX90510.1 trehalose synthase [Streptomyces minutiscleroticus]
MTQTRLPTTRKTGIPDLPEVAITPVSPLLLSDTIGAERSTGLDAALGGLREALGSRRVIHVNSTRSGGGVAEMLHRLLRYTRGSGVDARWFTIEGDPLFFDVTKRLHHMLHGHDAPGPSLDPCAAAHYAAISERNARALLRTVRPGDVVNLHDPQVAGLTIPLRRAGARVVWRCHIGTDTHNQHTAQAWEFLRPFLDTADAYVFTRAQYVPDWLADRDITVMPPSIDPLSAKNRPLEPGAAAAIVTRLGLRAGPDVRGPVGYRRGDGSTGSVGGTPVRLVSMAPPPADAPLVVQISRWDPLKDMAGVMASFADGGGGLDAAHLALVGPDVSGVSDDPEGGRVFDRCVELWRRLPARARSRVHLVCLPLADPEENAVMVSAVQYQATVVTQKSIAEGFGLTVTEAMWKGRPVVASAVGGIRDQIHDGVHGLLLHDPADRADFVARTGSLVSGPQRARSLGEGARRRAGEHFLDDRQLRSQAALYSRLAAA